MDSSRTARPTRSSHPWALALVGLGSASAYLAGLAAAKPVPVVCLALGTMAVSGRYARLVALGLLLSATADVAIERSFIAGLALFLLAHLAYVAAFLQGHPPLRPLRAVPVLAALAMAFSAVALGLGPLRGPVIAYMAAIGTMVWRAAARVGRNGPARAAEWSALIGAVLFATSDTLIAIDRFRTPVSGARAAIIVLYWAGQLGIALSARGAD